jgi:transposase-like protein
MKKSKICPKCNSQEIIRIPGQVRGYGSGNNIITGMTIFSAVKVTRYLCADCGFSEEWIDDPKDIKKLKDIYKAKT